MKRFALWLALILLVLGLGGCSNSTPTPQVIIVTPTPIPSPPTQNVSALIPDLGRGQQVFIDQKCVSCHGFKAEGGIGPTLAHLDMSFPVFLEQVRAPVAPMPGYDAFMVTDKDAYDIYGWLRSLPPVPATSAPTATAIDLEECEDMNGMTLWINFHCDDCHGVFAQGSLNGPPLAQMSYPLEEELARMRATGEQIPEHRADRMNDKLFSRLYDWLRTGAGIGEGECVPQ